MLRAGIIADRLGKPETTPPGPGDRLRPPSAHPRTWRQVEGVCWSTKYASGFFPCVRRSLLTQDGLDRAHNDAQIVS